MKKLIGILGGTFDPIHRGHILIAEQFQHYFPDAEIRFIPTKIPLLKDPAQTTSEQRLEMLQIALKDFPNIIIDQRELQRESPS
ncbi:MAG: adenylyltransferase/cytidyltransferase family protein, partial [Proteobacteria bacterium]|nr:adenylyltransferase/cytidyltransferase family protein [Pseudomonadota bacterium]